MTKVVAIIPARSGSKGVIHKNIRKVKNHSLLDWSISACKKSNLIDDIYISTDSQEYQNIAISLGGKAPFLRPKEFSTDISTDYEMIKHFLDWMKANKSIPDYLVHIRPTTPLRKISHIDNAIKIMKKNSKNYNSLRSINSMSQTSYKTLRIVNKKLCGITKLDFDMDKFNLPRNMYSETYEANGIVDIYKTKNIINGYLLGKKVFPYKIDFLNSDINTPNDFKIFEKLKTI